MTAALTNMPGSSASSGFGNVAWIDIMRVSVRICGSIVVILALKLRPGNASTVTSTSWPSLTCSRIVEGSVKLA